MAAEISYDKEADALTVTFAATPAIEGEEVRPGLIVHFDGAERIVAIEILHARETLAQGSFPALRAAE